MTNPYAPPLASVRDIAEHHAISEPADRSTRLGAAILDSLIMAAMVYGPMIVGLAIGAATASASGGSTDVMLGLTIVLTLGGFVAWVWLTVRQLNSTGQSLGKKYCGIKVVRTDGSPISLGRLIWLRNVVNWLISIVPLYGLIDALFIFGESRQCLHDKIADTIVIKA